MESESGGFSSLAIAGVSVGIFALTVIAAVACVMVKKKEADK